MTKDQKMGKSEDYKHLVDAVLAARVTPQTRAIADFGEVAARMAEGLRAAIGTYAAMTHRKRYMRLVGAVTITPPIGNAELSRDVRYDNIRPRITTASDELPEGTLYYRQAGSVTVTQMIESDKYKIEDAYNDAVRLVQEYPGHEFAGIIEYAGDERFEVWYIVFDGREVRLVSPDITFSVVKSADETHQKE